MFRQGIVVAVHPRDHSVDLVMLDDGSRQIGVPVLTSNGSGNSGTFDMPPAPDRGKNKWDIKSSKQGDQIAFVGFMRGSPFVVGFMYPQTSEMRMTEGDRFLYRHPHSDVTVSIESTGAMHIKHPGGFSLSIGTPDNPKDGDNSKTAANKFDVTKNKDQRLDFSISFPGFNLKADKDGVTFDCQTFKINSKDVKINSKAINLNAKKVKTSENLMVGGMVIPNAKQIGS